MSAYINSVEKKIFKVRGEELAPLTIMHAKLLYMLKSPFVRPTLVVDEDPEGENPTSIKIQANNLEPEDYFALFRVCKEKYALKADDFVRMSENLSMSDVLLFMENFEKHSKVINAYLEYYLEMPTLDLPAQDDSKSEKTPWIWKMAILTAHFLGKTTDEVDSMLCCEVFSILATIYSYKQGVDHISEYDLAVEKKIKK